MRMLKDFGFLLSLVLYFHEKSLSQRHKNTNGVFLFVRQRSERCVRGSEVTLTWQKTKHIFSEMTSAAL